MNNEIRLAMVTDNPPVREDVQAWGMCRVNTRLFRALSNHVAVIISGSQGYMYQQSDIAEELRDRCIMETAISRVTRFARHIIAKLQSNDFIFDHDINHYVSDIRKSNANWVFCPCGVNPYALWRGLRIAQASGLPLAVYLVDDFLSGAVLSGNKKNLHAAQHDVQKWMKCVDQIFVISEGLRLRIKELYNLDSQVINLPYKLPLEFDTKQQKTVENQVIFVGNLSHFYIDGLKQMAKIIEELNRERNTQITLRLTLPNQREAKILLGNFECIRCKPCEDAEELNREIKSSILCFVPYSFDLKYQEMVSTSFPSKILDYLSSARFILVYGPEYATSVAYFREHGLDKVICCQNTKELQDTVLYQMHKSRDYSNAYQDAVLKFHDSGFVANQIISTISGL